MQLPYSIGLWYCNSHIFPSTFSESVPRTSEIPLTSKARKSKPTHIEKVLPIARIVELFRQRFHDPYLNPEAEIELAEFQTAFPDISQEELHEALAHWTLYPGARVLSTKKIEFEGREIQVWYIHGLHEENAALEHLTRHGSVPI